MSRSKWFSTNKKILSLGTFMRNIKALALTVQKLLARLKFSKNGSNSKVKVTESKIMVPTERSYHREYSCETSKLWHSLFKSISKVKYFKNGSNSKVKVTGKKK